MLVVFPGQGSQNIGMGADIYQNFSCARDVFHEVDDAISFKLSDLIFNGTEEDLKQTQNTQPAIMSVSIAFFKVLEKEFGVNFEEKASFFAGHSLGEYTALCASGAISLSDTAKILRIRGKAMSDAYPVGGAMSAIIGLDIETVTKITEDINLENISKNLNLIVQIANDNSSQQIVISGNEEAVAKASERAKDKGAKRAVILEVSGPFHSVLMKNAIDPLQEILDSVKFSSPVKPIISNVTAKAETSGFKDLLIQQVTSKVRWTETIQFAEKEGVLKCVEIGPGRVLTGLVKRIASEIETINVNSIESISESVSKF